MAPTSVKGVIYNARYKTTPYYFQTMVNGVRKYQWFPTLEAAAKAKRDKESAKVAPAIAKKARLKEKRARDLQKHGNDCKQERDAALDIKTCADATYGPGTAIVMNDGTRADVLFKVALLYLQLQLKTTATKVKNKNGYHFNDVLGYAGMLVVCWVVDLKKAWVFDGTWLNERGQEKLYFTPGSETHALAKALTMDQLIAYLHDHTHAEHLRLTTEDAARNDFNSEKHKQEKFGIDAYIKFKPGTHDWPRDQNGKYDTTLWTCEDEDDKTLRVQHKSCCPLGNQAGLYCPNLGKSDGTDLDSNQLYRCYDKDDADLYVFHYHHEPTNTSHFWEIPSEALAEHRYFTKTTKKESIYLYGCPVAKQPNPNACRRADTWTSAFYTGELKHA